jgi:enamine deaminase RidA (YjgF/YER057c/UK114 family)
MPMPIRKALEGFNVVLPKVSGPFGAYVPAKVVGDLVYVAGQLPMKDGQLMAAGQVPSRCPIETAKAAARQCVVNALASIVALGGDALLERLAGVVRVGAFVSSDGGFTQQPQVANGASEMLVELFGEAGKHVRAAVGVNTLPLDAAVEIEFIFQIAPEPVTST